MWEEVAKFPFLGTELYAWGTCCAVGALLAMIFLWVTLPGRTTKKGTAALTGFLSMVLAVICSRVFFCLLDRGLGQTVPFFAWFGGLTGGGWSVMGALGGVALGSFLSARIMGEKAGNVLDVSLIAFLLFLFMERVGENWIPDFDISRQLSDSTAFLSNTALAVKGEYGDIAYLRTYLLQAAGAFVLYLVLCFDLRKSKKPGNTALLFLLLFGVWQGLTESLRYDYHISISFVGLQQIASIVLVTIAMVILAVRVWNRKKALALTSVIALPVCFGTLLGLEFVLDRSAASHILVYFFYILLLALLAVLGIMLRKADQ